MACSFSAITVINTTTDLGTPFNVYARLKTLNASCTVTWSGLTLSKVPKVRLGFSYSVGGVIKNTQYTDVAMGAASGSQAFTFAYGITGEADGTAISVVAFVSAFYDSTLEQIAAGTDVTNAMTYYNMSVLAVSAFSVTRCDANGTTNIAGTSAKVTISYLISSLGGGNSQALVVRYRLVGATSWSTFTVTISAYAGTVTDLVMTGLTFDQIQSYEMSAEVTDLAKTVTRAAVLGAAKALLHLAADKLHIGIGKFCEAGGPGLDIDMDTWVRNPAYFLSKLMPLCLMNNPTAEDMVFNSTLRYWIFGWTVNLNGSYTTIMGGVSSARNMGVVIPATGFYRMTFILFLNKASTSSSASAFIARIAAATTFNPPTTVNYMTQAQILDIAAEYKVQRALAYNSQYTHIFMTVDMYCTVGDKIVPTAYVGDVSKTIASGQTAFSVQRIG